MVITNDKYCVYAHINKINGKIYIGQTCQNTNRRWGDGSGYKGCTRFYRAVQKYGWDNFEHEVVASNLTLDEANHFEELLISMLDTTNSDRGYNLRSGGENNRLSEETKQKLREATKGKHLSAETKEKLSKAHKGKKLSNETKRKLSELNKGKNHPKYGQHLSDETKEKIRHTKMGVNNPNYGKSGASNPNARAVICIETNTVYGSTIEASREFGIIRSGITRCCSGKTKTAGGYHWKYADDVAPDDIAV
jgi:group I intron endonuclease